MTVVPLIFLGVAAAAWIAALQEEAKDEAPWLVLVAVVAAVLFFVLAAAER